MRPVSADEVLDLLDTPFTAAAVGAAIEMGLFWLLEERAFDEREVAQALRVPPRRCRHWLGLLCHVGLLENGPDGYRPTEQARAAIAEHLSDEIAHRVKNNLAMVSGLLQMQLLGQRDPEVAVALREAITRVRAFVSIHEQMYSESGPVDLLITLRSIANNIKEVFAARKDVAISVTGGGLLCASRVATNLSVVANELLINALKHGSPGADGQLRVLLSVTSDDGCVVIAVWNSGRPVAADFDVAQRRNMGLRVVLDVVHGYGGTFALQPDGAGTRAEAVLNLEELSSTH